MKIKDVPTHNTRGRTRARTLEYLENNPDDVFRIRQCAEIAEALDAPQRTVEHALWSLQRDALVRKSGLSTQLRWSCGQRSRAERSL
jgi:DNA-binding IclR family transcriptional regulator